jgi:hypothetical protein
MSNPAIKTEADMPPPNPSGSRHITSDTTTTSLGGDSEDPWIRRLWETLVSQCEKRSVEAFARKNGLTFAQANRVLKIQRDIERCEPKEREAKFAQLLQELEEAREHQDAMLDAKWLEIEKLEAEKQRAEEKRHAEKQRQRAKARRQATRRRAAEKEMEFTNAIANQSDDETSTRECDVESELGLLSLTAAPSEIHPQNITMSPPPAKTIAEMSPPPLPLSGHIRPGSIPTPLSVDNMSRTKAVPEDVFLDMPEKQLSFANRHGVSFEHAGWLLDGARREIVDVMKKQVVTKKELEFTNGTVNQSQDETAAREFEIETMLALLVLVPPERNRENITMSPHPTKTIADMAPGQLPISGHIRRGSIPTSLSVATMSRTNAVPRDAFLDFLDEQRQFANRHGLSFEQAGWFLEKRREMDYMRKKKQKHEAPPADMLHKWQDPDALLEDYYNSVTIRTDTTPAEISDASTDSEIATRLLKSQCLVF